MIEQGSDEWFKIRCGKLTASRLADVIATTKTGPSASRKNYMAQLVAERLTGTIAESFTNSAMQHGIEHEQLARAEYELIKDMFVSEVGFIDHPTIAMTGASPDGLVGADGLLEIKCPNTATHIEYLLANKVPSKYKPQMAWQLACTGRQWVDFVSYDPRLPKNMGIFLIRYVPEPGYLDMLEQAAKEFLREADDLVEKLLAISKTV